MELGHIETYTLIPSTTVAIRSTVCVFPVCFSTDGEMVAVQRRLAIVMNRVSLAK